MCPAHCRVVAGVREVGDGLRHTSDEKVFAQKGREVLLHRVEQLPVAGLHRLEAEGVVDGAAIYSTRLRAPHRAGDWAFTRGKGGETYAIRLWTKGPERTLELPPSAGRFGRAVRLATGAVSPISKDGTFSFATDEWPDDIADAFRLE